MKGNIPRAGPKYRLGMYFETIHNLPSFDNDSWCYDDGGYTSYWETDTEVDSDLGNFIFNNVSGDSASLICIDDTVDIVSIRKRQQEAIALSKHCQPHYKLEQNRMSPSTPSDDRSLECSIDSKNSSRSRQSHRSGSDGSYDQPPPVPPPRKSKALATAAAVTDEFEDHTYETLDDCREDFVAHNQEMIYISKGSEGSRGSRESGLKPASTEDAESDRLSSNKGGEDCGRKTPDRNASGGGAKPRSNSLHLNKTRESLNYRQRRKMSDPSTSRKRRSEKVASKGSGYPAPMKGFPTGVSEEYVEYLSQPVGGCHSPDRNNTSGSGSPVGQRDITVASPERRKTSGGAQKSNTIPNHLNLKKGVASTTQPLVIKHKGKTYFVPVVDQKLEKELEKKSKTNNPTVSIKRHHFSSHSSRPNGVHGLSALTSAGHTYRSPASPPKVEPTDCASPNKRKGTTSFKSPPHTASTKQVTHYGVL